MIKEKRKTGHRSTGAQVHKCTRAKVLLTYALMTCAFLFSSRVIAHGDESVIKDESLQNSIPADSSTGVLERQLLKSSLTPPGQERLEDKTTARLNAPQDGLRQIIEQIRSVRIKQSQPAQKTTEDRGRKTEYSSPSSVISHPSSERPEVPAVKVDAPSTTEKIMQDIEALIKEPNHISNPLELAENLFRIGKPGLAAVCYKQALSLIPPDDPNQHLEREWILFQIGNCLKYDDPNAARESYEELLRTNPDSPWAEAARFRHNLIDWLQKEHPAKLIQELKP
jgi:tetratricopeptide (TPR) repeat protein